MARKSNMFERLLFKPSKIRNLDGTSKVTNVSLAESAQDSFGVMSPTSSFRFDPAGTGLKNTQQLNIDFSKFENHTFFNSARNKVHVGFDKIINTFPFDGTRAEHEEFLNKISGFEKHLLDRFPKNVGFLILTRTLDETGADSSENEIGSLGNYLSVVDHEGSGIFDDLDLSSGQPKLDFKNGPFTVEFSLFIPSLANDCEVVAQRLETEKRGFTIALSHSANTSNTDLLFALSDDNKSTSLYTNIEKGKFNHVAAVYDREDSEALKLYINGNFVTQSNPAAIGGFNFVDTKFNIGSGSTHTFGTSVFDSFVPKNTLSGALDEFRYFNSARKQSDIEKYKSRELYAQSDLDLYFRFNEPSGTFDKNGTGNSSLVLDYSGNGMHTSIENFNMSQRATGALASTVDNMISEDPSLSPVLFPSFQNVQTLATELISSASQYDAANPNLITRMVPQHYLTDAAAALGRPTKDGQLSSSPGMLTDQPGGNRLNQAQLISSVLFMWADTFDNIKMFIDEVSRLQKVDYVSDRTISNHLLPFLANYHGFSLPSQFNSTTQDQYFRGRNLNAQDMLNNLSLQNIQNEIWRRILTDLPEIRRTKGTRAAFRSVLRSMGINPDGAFRIREYGGSPTRKISDSFESRTEIAAMMNFSGTLSAQGTLERTGEDPNRPLLRSAFLSGARVEPGYPEMRGNFTLQQVTELGQTKFVHASNNKNDGLFTSGSWTAEGIYKFDGKINHPRNQSLLRMQTTGSGQAGPQSANSWLLFNVVATAENKRTSSTGSVSLYGRPRNGASDQELKITVPGVNIFDGSKWHVSFGRSRADKNNHLSSSYFLRVGKNRISGEPIFHTASDFYIDGVDTPLTVLNAFNNASGAMLVVGSQSLVYDSDASFKYLNRSSHSLANYVDFTGRVCGIRFFSKDLTEKETKTHIRNFKSVGVEDPTVNFSFSSKLSGSFERLRLDMSLDQLITKSDSFGAISGFDFSQNRLFGTGSGFEPNKQIIDPERFDYRIFSPKFELSSADNKIRIRSFINADKAETKGVSVAPLVEIPQGDRPFDDRRFEIEISSVQALNEDIMNIFATLDFFDNAIGDPELVFAVEYRDLRHLRRIYFNRLQDKVSYKKFFDFFKWFDNTVGDIFEELVPRTSRYLGTNFVIESHALERPKFTYNYTDMYLGELDRRAASLIFLQQFVGSLKKF